MKNVHHLQQYWHTQLPSPSATCAHLTQQLGLPRDSVVELLDAEQGRILIITEPAWSQRDAILFQLQALDAKPVHFVYAAKRPMTLSEAPHAQALLANAYQLNASDIHIESVRKGGRIRVRIQGRLIEQQRLSQPDLETLIAQLKVLAEVDVTETKQPQDGRIDLTVADRVARFRLNACPGSRGESIVVRCLHGADQLPAIHQLGLTPRQFYYLAKQLASGIGLILVSGPTGSGKSTTIYSIIKQLSELGLRVCSVEDPVEVELDGVLQTPVRPQLDLTFARVLRAFLRQDPDVIMIGEIRDAETAKIAVQAALTGHLVIASIHAETAIDVIRRLVQLGAQQADVTAALKLVINQRLLARPLGGVRIVFELLPWPERLRGYTSDLAHELLDDILAQYQLPSLQSRIHRTYQDNEHESVSSS